MKRRQQKSDLRLLNGFSLLSSREFRARHICSASGKTKTSEKQERIGGAGSSAGRSGGRGSGDRDEQGWFGKGDLQERAVADPGEERGTRERGASTPQARRGWDRTPIAGGWEQTPISIGWDHPRWQGCEQPPRTWQDREPSLSTMHSAFSWHGLISPFGQRRVPGAVWLLQPLS